MGLFTKKKKKIFVDTHTVNLAGDIKDAPSFIKTVVVDQTIHKPYSSYSDAITSNLIDGAGMKLRSFARWAESTDFYKKIGMTKQSAIVGSVVDTQVIHNAISTQETDTVVMQSASVETASIDYWIDEYIIKNMVDKIEEPYFSFVNEGGSTAGFYFVDDELNAISETYTVPLVDYVEGAPYLFATYMTKKGRTNGLPATTGFIGVDEFTDVTEWDDLGGVSDRVEYNYLEHTKVTRYHKDGEVEIITDKKVTKTEIKTEKTREFHRIVPIPATDSYPYAKERDEKLYQKSGYTPIPSKTEREEEYEEYKDVTEVNSYQLVPSLKEKIDSRTDELTAISPLKLIKYRKGSGNKELDKVFDAEKEEGVYYPFIPIKRNKVWLDSDDKLWPELKKAFRKASGSNQLGKLVKDVKKGDGSEHIDFSFIIFGASINTKEPNAKRYLYHFFNKIQGNIEHGENSIEEYLREMDLYDASLQKYVAWQNAQKDPNNPLFGKPDPGLLPLPPVPSSGFSIKSGHTVWELAWNAIEKTEHSSNPSSTDIKVGEVSIVAGQQIERDSNVAVILSNPGSGNTSSGGFGMRKRFNTDLSSIYLTYRLSDSKWERLTVYGLRLNNHIYAGRSVNILAYSEMSNKEESGLIIPLNTALYRQMNLIHATQMTNAISYLVTNSYQVIKVKKPRFGGKFLGVALVIVIGVVTGGAGFAAGAGILGANIAVGSAIGLAGVAAIVAGALANAIAAIIVTNIITKASKMILGDALGNIVGLVASIIAVSYLSGYSLSDSIADVFSPKNLFRITESAINTVGEQGMLAAQQIMSDTQKLIEDREKEADELRALLETGDFTNNGIIDPMKYTQMVQEIRVEQPDNYFNRTLLTGMDIADLSMESISMFTDLALDSNLKI